jgi:hypothetical protein
MAKSSKSPTARTLERARKLGYTIQVVERWNPHAKIRQDLFGCIDLVAITPSGIVGIQACAASSHAARRTKALLEPRLAAWCRAGGHFEVWSWKQDAAGKWDVRIEQLDTTVLAHAVHEESKVEAA